MARAVATAAAVFLALTCAATAAMGQSSFEARVIGVADGDTITVLRAERPLTIRLQGIDCPERGQAFGGAAKRFTSDLVFGKTVGIQPRTTDRYGRMVAEVSIEGRDVGLALVETGLAWHFTRYSSDPKLAATEQAARAARQGLWADSSPVAPWDYRHPRPSQRTPPWSSTATCRATSTMDLGVSTTAARPAWWNFQRRRLRPRQATAHTPSARNEGHRCESISIQRRC